MVPVAHALAPNAESGVLKYHPVEHPVALQLGGHDIQQLAAATKRATQMGYDAVNLNCGCPSPHVTNNARRGGAALMREPDHVAACASAMLEAATSAAAAMGRDSPPLVTVKHRLAAVDDSVEAPYDAEADRRDGPAKDLESARGFIQTVAAAGVTRFQVHARKALMSASEEDAASVAVAGGGGDQEARTGEQEVASRKKIDHKRVAAKTKKAFRSRTLANRSVPPLRPEVVRALAQEFGELELVMNGGVRGMDDLMEHLEGGNGAAGAASTAGGGKMLPLHGVMVGRAAINHPCAFSGVDDVLYPEEDSCGLKAEMRCHTRGEVLDRYIEYVMYEEALMDLDALTPQQRETEMKKLVAPPYQLFVGEAGNR